MMLHEALDMAVRLRLIVKNPTVGTTIPKNNYPPKQILNDEQLDRFMKRIRQDELWYDFFYTELTTGLRRGEICGLRWEDFDAENGKLKIRRSVTKKKGGGLNIGETKTETGTRNSYKGEKKRRSASGYSRISMSRKNRCTPTMLITD